MRADDLIAQAITKAAEAQAKRATRVRVTTLPAEYVGRDSEGKSWVLLPGATSPTPVRRMAVEADLGDTVSVTIGNGRAVIDSNISNPSAGVVGVRQVRSVAQGARLTAEGASKDAQAAIGYASSARLAAKDAKNQAESATTSAATANDAANRAVADAATANAAAESAVADAATASASAATAIEQANSAIDSAHTAANRLSDVERVVGTVNWIAEHGAYLLTADNVVDPSRVYYELVGGRYEHATDTLLDPYKQYYEQVIGYVPTQDEAVAEGKTYYERSVEFSYALTEDTEPDPSKTYYVEDGGEYVEVLEPDASEMSTYYERAEQVVYTAVADPDDEDVASYYEQEVSFAPVRQPVQADIGTYYERFEMTAVPVESPAQAGLEGYFNLYVDEAVQNYIASHLYLMDDGLYVATTREGHRVRVSSDGVDILDPSSDVLSSFTGDGVVIGKPDEMRVSLTSDRLSFVDPRGAEAAYVAVNDSGFSVMYISRSVVVEDMQFGYDRVTEKCRWKWYSRANGNMSLKWMGE